MSIFLLLTCFTLNAYYVTCMPNNLSYIPPGITICAAAGRPSWLSLNSIVAHWSSMQLYMMWVGPWHIHIYSWCGWAR